LVLSHQATYAWLCATYTPDASMQKKILNNRYELEQKIGEGGMARVYRGRDLRLNRRVAIKVLHEHYAADVSFLQRFHHEAQAAAGLRHPCIVNVYDVGQDGDTHYIVMEYVEGSDLKSLILRNGPLPVDQAVAIAEDVAGGLEAAHRLGMVHRDVKPQNILVSPSGEVKITDFGIAKSSLSTALTETGMTFGTADYLSPEQARGFAATPRSDIYSLGVTLYEMLTGRLPFTGENAVAVAMQHVSVDPPPPRMFNPQIPPHLETLVLTALSKNPDERPASAHEFAQMLRAYRAVSQEATIVRPVAPRQGLPRAAPGPVSVAPAGNSGGRVMPPPRSPAITQAPESGERDLGVFLLGMMFIGIVLGVVYLAATGTFDNLFNPGSGTRPPPITLPEPTATPEVTPTPEMVMVPNVIGLDERAAIATIEGANLLPYAELPRASDVVSAGLVFDQFPPPATLVTVSTVVTYVVSTGPDQIPLPEVVTMRGVDAEFQLRSLGFQVQVVSAPDRLSAGFVFRTEPVAGTPLRRGDTVTIFVSLGDKVRMPDVTGLPEEEAIRRISAAGLTWSYSDYQGCDKLGDLCDRYAPGVVVSSIPRGGDLVDRGSPVTLGVRAP
jgi:beta-lactam-binding protein with PASTA domain